MNYALAFLTMGGREDLAARILDSFHRHVAPEPTRLFCHVDGFGFNGREPLDLGPEWERVITPERSGFCAACETTWEAVVQMEDCDWVFWLEDDFEFIRPLDLRALAAVMDRNEHVAQMTLYRTPYSQDEHDAGGYLNMPHRRFERRATDLLTGVTKDLGMTGWAEHDELPWYEHREYWTTNPSLFRRQLMIDNPWPPNGNCEGQMGFEVRGSYPGATFGIWGAGSFWVDHIGVRSGIGY